MNPPDNIDGSLKRISLFPLPSTVFFPNANLPLHIFEPRYREMVSDSLNDKQWIGMVLLKPGWRKDYLNKPEIESIGCAGEIQDCHRLEDGKFNLVLQGLHRFKIIQEVGDKAYRQADVQLLEEKNDVPIEELAKPRFEILRTRIQEYLQLLPEDHPQKAGMEMDNCLSLGHLMDQIIFLSEMSHENKQPFLEELNVMNRLKIIHPFLDRKISFLRRSKFLFEKGIDVSLN
jgi:Lon protease-like protein